MNQPHKFRFGVMANGITSRQEWLDQVRLIENLDYSSLLLPDHLHNSLAPFVAIMCAAEATDSLRLGTFVLGNDFRHPVIMAKEDGPRSSFQSS